jgi:hypothetical protein
MIRQLMFSIMGGPASPFAQPEKIMPKKSTVHRIHIPRSAQVLLPLALLVGALFPPAASAAPRLRCQLSQGGAVQVVEFTPVADPYRVKSIDIRENFRFKAVVIGDEQKIDYIKLYTYYHSKRQPVLLHEAKYLAPTVLSDPTPDALTGTNTLYSPNLEREFQYGCTLFEVAP